MRGTLTDNELRFLASQGLGPDDVFDARWIHNGRRKRLMEEENKTAALGTPCQKAGHGLRTRAGQCTQRDTSKPAFQSRHRRDRYVYIAGSLSERLLKIGTCSDCKQMGHQLRTEKYGSVGDWRIIYSIEVPNAGDVRSYVKDGFLQTASELLQCSFSQALDAVNESVGDGKLGEPWKSFYVEDYEFTEPRD
jgi:hypothetical protein